MKKYYFFPSLGRSILANSREEADQIIAGEISDNEDKPAEEKKAMDPEKINNRGTPRRISNK